MGASFFVIINKENKHMDNRCAIFLKADPLMKKDVIAIKMLLKIYNEVDIILDRKWQKDKYLLNFTERCEVIKHDLKSEGIDSYNILANDVSKYDSAVKAGIKNLAFIYDNYTKPDEIAERYAMTKRMIPDINIIMIPILLRQMTIFMILFLKIKHIEFIKNIFLILRTLKPNLNYCQKLA